MSRTNSPYLICALLLVFSCQSPEAPADRSEEARTFTNPILAGFNPDPSICRVGEDYYLVNSSFAYFPGIPILHSKDLVNWNQIGSAITRTEQMDFSTHGVSRGLFAPAISYHEGWFYIVCTMVDQGGNFVVRAQQPEGPYSDPYWLPKVNGIDPSLFFDDDDKAYIVYNSIPPDDVSLYSGHRTIRAYEFSLDSMNVVGEEKLLINGGTDISKEPVWIEAPHFYKIDGYYYLICAEGGTAYEHSEVVFRAKEIFGPYQVYENNPILTQRHLDPSRPNPITSTGHADLVQTPAGEWWAVFLGCRPYEGGHYNTGRETFLAPVHWVDGWPVINPDHEEVQYHYPLPVSQASTEAKRPLSGNFTDRDDFTSSFDQRWLFLRNLTEKWYEYQAESGTLTIDLRPEVIGPQGNPSLLLKRQPHLHGSAGTHLTFGADGEHEMAGFLVMQNDEHYYLINKGPASLTLLKQTEDGYEELARQPYEEDDVHLKIVARGSTYDFRYSTDGNTYQDLATDVDARYLSTETAAGFVGCLYGLYASSNGEDSANQAIYHYLEIATEEDVYQ